MEIEGEVAKKIMKNDMKILINSLRQYIEWYGKRSRIDDKLKSIDEQNDVVKLSFELLDKLGSKFK